VNILSLDIGLKRTGVAFADTDSKVPVSLKSLEHGDMKDLAGLLPALIEERGIEHIVLGLPLLPSGEEGHQAELVRDFASQYLEGVIPLSFIDERYTTPREKTQDGDSVAALAILTTYLDLLN
jgi:putative transcription antitermination factor YqgF